MRAPRELSTNRMKLTAPAQTMRRGTLSGCSADPWAKCYASCQGRR